MMKIDKLSVSPDYAGRYRVQFEDGSVMRLYRQTLEDFALYSGMEMDEDLWNRLQTAAGEMSAKMRAVRIVSASSISKRDLEQRLVRKGEDPLQAKNAVQWMADLELLDDRKTAEQVVSRCISKGYGLSRAKQALYEKRIPKEFWDEALSDYPDQTEMIVSFMKSKLGHNWQDKDLKRTIDAAMRRGHSYYDIRKALALLEADLEEFPEEL